MLTLRTKDPALAQLDRQIGNKLREYRNMLRKADTDPTFLKYAESAYEDMNAMLELRRRSAKRQTTG